MNDLNDLAILARVADRLSFEAAARDLGLSASTVSRRVAALESRLGVQLVLRTTRSVRPTASGLEYAEHCRAMIAAAERADALAFAQRDGMHGELSINAPALFGRLTLTPIVAEFARRHPAVRIRFSFSNTRVDLTADGFDLVIRTGELPDSGLRARRLATSAFAIVASPDCLARHGTPTTIAEVIRAPCLALDRGADSRWCTGSQTEPIPVEPVLLADDNEVLRDLAIAGLGFAFLPRFAAASAIADGRLAELALDITLGEAPVSIVFPGHKVPNKCASALADLIVASVARDPAEEWRVEAALNRWCARGERTIARCDRNTASLWRITPGETLPHQTYV